MEYWNVGILPSFHYSSVPSFLGAAESVSFTESSDQEKKSDKTNDDDRADAAIASLTRGKSWVVRLSRGLRLAMQAT
jgi:hypothetical protein